MNLNKAAKNVTLREGGKESLSIAQVKEVIRLFLIESFERSNKDDLWRTVVRTATK